jgi:protein SCO1
MSANKRVFLAFATATVALAIALAACSRHGAAVIEPGSYPAANSNDCLPEITLVDQHGNPLTLASLKGRPVLIDFIYTNCPGPCPLITARMVTIAKLLGPRLGKQVTFISLTIDPEHDNSGTLLKYARETGANVPGWLFLTGAPTQIDRLLTLYHLRRDRQADGTLTHAVASFLLGPDGRQVRQYAPLGVKASTVVGDIDRASE